MLLQSGASKVSVRGSPFLRVLENSAMKCMLLFPLLVGLFSEILCAPTLQADEPTATTDAENQPITPTKTFQLFNGTDLAGWEVWLKKTGLKDPDQVFSVEENMIRAGDGDHGYLATKQVYKDYHLSLEFKWGRKNPNDKYVRNSGVLLNGVGPHGSAGGVWMTSIECQLAQGCEGDLIVIPGKDRESKAYPATITSETVIAEDKNTRWKRGGKPVAYSGRQFWWSKHEPFFEELIDTRGKNDVASPLGEWTRVECICQGDRITIKINGEEVNEALDVKPAAGRILLQTEGHEIWFRNVMLSPIQVPNPTE
jgi:hypothetical protein